MRLRPGADLCRVGEAGECACGRSSPAVARLEAAGRGGASGWGVVRSQLADGGHSRQPKRERGGLTGQAGPAHPRPYSGYGKS